MSTASAFRSNETSLTTEVAACDLPLSQIVGAHVLLLICVPMFVHGQLQVSFYMPLIACLEHLSSCIRRGILDVVRSLFLIPRAIAIVRSTCWQKSERGYQGLHLVQ